MKRLDKVEDKMTAASPTSPQKLSTSKLSTSSVVSSVKNVKSKRSHVYILIRPLIVTHPVLMY